MSLNDISKIMTDSDMLKILLGVQSILCRGMRLTETNMKQFEEVALSLRNILPEVTDVTLYDIDDILYQNEDLTNVQALSFGSKESSTNLHAECASLYLYLHPFMFSRDLAPLKYSNRHILDETCLRIVEHSPTEISENERYVDSVVTFLDRLMETKVVSNLCLTLKILKLALKSNRQRMINELQQELGYNCIVLLVQKILNIPQARSQTQRRMRNWLSQQASFILDVIDLKSFKFFDEARKYNEYCDNENSQPEQQLDSTYLKEVVHPLRDIKFLTFYCDHLYSFFMTTKSNEERIQRLKDFSISIWRWNRSYPDNVLRAMEKMYGCEIEDYLSGVKINTNEVLGDVKSELFDNEGSSFPIPDDEEDYTIERFLFFDAFKKELQLLNIFHTLFMTCQELLGAKGDRLGHESRVFCDSYQLTKYLKNAILNPEKRELLPWIIEVVYKTCPFLMIPKTYEYLMTDLMKKLKGEEVDEYTDEEIYFAVNLLQQDFSSKWTNDLDLYDGDDYDDDDDNDDD